jgi:hypothetical protein
MFNKLTAVFSCMLVTSLLFALPAQAAPGLEKIKHGWSDQPISYLTGTDDWLPGAPDGILYCSEGELDMSNPVMPSCPPGTTLELREVTAQARLFGDDPRMVGLLSYSVNGSLDALMFSGPVWGTWTLEVESCDGLWEGTFHGQRSYVPNQPGPLGAGMWIGALKLRGTGSGGCVDRLRMSGTELVTTLTPMPIAYEMIPGFCDFGCLPEGVIAGRIYPPRKYQKPE